MNAFNEPDARRRSLPALLLYTLTTMKTKQLPLMARLLPALLISFMFASSGYGQEMFETKQAGAWNAPSTWVGNNVPNFTVNNYNRIYIKHSVAVGSNILIRKGEVKVFAGAELNLNNANLATKPNGRLFIDGGKVYVQGGGILNEGKNNYGGVYLTDAYLEVSGDYENNTGGEMYFDTACVRITSGSFVNQSGSPMNGSGNVEVEGVLANYGTWSSGINYCSVPAPIGLSASLNCASDVELACNCLEGPCNPNIIQGTFGSGIIISAGLNAYARDEVDSNLIDDLFILNGDTKILIDVVWQEDVPNAYEEVLSILTSAPYNVTTGPLGDIVYDGGHPDADAPSNFATLYFPIGLILDLDGDANAQQYILEVRQTPRGLFSAVEGCDIIRDGSGLDNQGDVGQESFLLRLGYGLSGEGIDVGILSDSYNKSGADTDPCYLPGEGNSKNTTPVTILKDLPSNFPLGQDEGRAMAQIVHSIAPKANLYFHTAFEGPGAMAEAILTMGDLGVEVMTDDITHPTQPFFYSTATQALESSKPLVATAVDVVTDNGAKFFTSAGNFGSRAYSKVFTPFSGNDCHVFGPAADDTLQAVDLTEAGEYLMVLQWNDPFASIADNGGAVRDIDVIFADEFGNDIYIFSEKNIGKDPVEIVPFFVKQPTTTYIKIKQVGGSTSGSPDMKYILYKAGPTGNGFQPQNTTDWGQGTITGHAAFSGFTLGAVRWTTSPQWALENSGVPFVESFSSRGDLSTPGKPDAVAVQGANVGFEFGLSPEQQAAAGLFNDGDILYNFYGTSSSSPHAAALATLLSEANTKFGIGYDVLDVMTAAGNTVDVDAAFGSNDAGAGMLAGYRTLSGFANPAPRIDNVFLSADYDSTTNTGGITIVGDYFLDGTTKVFIRGEEVPPSELTVTSTSITLSLDAIGIGNPEVVVFTDSLANGDGGSDTTTVLNQSLKTLYVDVQDASRTYGEAFDEAIVEYNAYYLDSTGTAVELTEAEYALLDPSLTFSTPSASELTNADQTPQIAVDIDTAVWPLGLAELYRKAADSEIPGNLAIEPLLVIIQTKDANVDYGAPLLDIVRDYEVLLGDENTNLTETIANTIKADILSEYLTAQESTDPAIANYLGVITQYSESNFGSFADFVSGTSLGPLTLSNNDVGGIACVTSSGALGPLTLSNTIGGTSIGPLTLSNSEVFSTEVLPVDAQLFWDTDNSGGVNLSTGPISAWGGPDDLSLANANPNFSLGPLTLSNTATVIASALAGGSLGPLTLSNAGFTGGLGALTLSNAPGYSLGPLTLSNASPGASLGPLTLSNTVAIFFEGDQSEDPENPDSIRLVPINLITNITPGTQYAIPAMFLPNAGQNYIVKYNYGEIVIDPLTIEVQLQSDVIAFGESTSAADTATISAGSLGYEDELFGNVIDSISIVDEFGNPWDGSPGTYYVVPVFTEWEIYNVDFTPGILQVNLTEIQINPLDATVFTCNPVVDPDNYEVIPAGIDLNDVFASGASAISAVSLIESPPKGMYPDAVVIEYIEEPLSGYSVTYGPAADLNVVTPSADEEETGCSGALKVKSSLNPLEGDLTKEAYNETEATGPVSIKAYPNPFSGELTIELKNFRGESADLQLVNMVGQVVRMAKVELTDFGKITMELSDLVSGVYFVRLKGDRVDHTLKLIKQ